MADEPLPETIDRGVLMSALAVLGLGDHVSAIRSMSISYDAIMLDMAVSVPGVQGSYQVIAGELVTVQRLIRITGDPIHRNRKARGK